MGKGLSVQVDFGKLGNALHFVNFFFDLQCKLVRRGAGCKQALGGQLFTHSGSAQHFAQRLVEPIDDGDALHLSSLPTFGAKCLIPKLPAFQAAYPHIALHFVPCVQGYDFSRPNLGCSILFGNGSWPGAVAEYITGRDVVLIAPPTAATQKTPKIQPKPALYIPEQLQITEQSIASMTLLHHISVPHAWAEWCAAHQVTGINPRRGPPVSSISQPDSRRTAGMDLALVPLVSFKQWLLAAV
ncbi:MAG: hypothetical protein H7Z77_02060 [Chitinophagaceae bacterium]|nr:hypothetical protein [Polaromonas sp.]